MDPYDDGIDWDSVDFNAMDDVIAAHKNKTRHEEEEEEEAELVFPSASLKNKRRKRTVTSDDEGSCIVKDAFEVPRKESASVPCVTTASHRSTKNREKEEDYESDDNIVVPDEDEELLSSEEEEEYDDSESSYGEDEDDPLVHDEEKWPGVTASQLRENLKMYPELELKNNIIERKKRTGPASHDDVLLPLMQDILKEQAFPIDEDGHSYIHNVKAYDKYTFTGTGIDVPERLCICNQIFKNPYRCKYKTKGTASEQPEEFLIVIGGDCHTYMDPDADGYEERPIEDFYKTNFHRS